MNEIYNEIRSLLNRWYAAECTPAEERRLEELLLSAEDLPADLEADKALFLSLSEMADDYIEGDIPAEYVVRISEAIEAEIGNTTSAETKEKAYVTPRRAIWFRRIAPTVGIAAALIGGILLLRPLINPSGSAEPEKLASVAKPQPSVSPEVSAVGSVDDAVEPASPAEISVSGSAHLANAVEKGNTYPKVRKTPEERIDDEEEDYYYLSEEEEARLAADNYRVISDECEAYAMMNTVFSRLEGYVIQEGYRMEGVTAQYEAEVTKLCSEQN